MSAAGQTGSGKTYTMGTVGGGGVPESQHGIIPRLVHDLYVWLDVQTSVRVSVSFLEIYGEELHDLLAPGAEIGKLQIREGRQGSIYVAGATEVEVSSQSCILQLLKDGVHP